MESFSLLKYWRGGGGGVTATSTSSSSSSAAANMRTTTIATSVLRPSAEPDDDGGDEGPFFDLEFAVPDEDSEKGEEDGGLNDEDDSAAGSDEEEGEGEGEGEFKFPVSPDGHRSDPSLSLSPSDDLFFKGRLVPLEPSSLVAAAAEPDSKPQSAVSLLKSATKLRVFMLASRKLKSAVAEAGAAPAAASPKQQQQSKFFVKFKVEEVPIVSLFTRDNSSRATSRAAKPHADDQTAAAVAAAEERRFSKEVVQKYLNKIKPLYLRVSKRYGEKLRFSGLLSSEGPIKEGGTDGETEAAGGGVKRQRPKVPAGLRVVRKHLGKSRSASSAVAAVPSPPPPPPPQRRDDSLLQQQDGIQSAIAHCKRSFHAARGSESPLVRSKSDRVGGQSLEEEKGDDCV